MKLPTFRSNLLGATILVALWVPSSAVALPTGVCTWDPPNGSLHVQYPSRVAELDRLGSIPCLGAPRDDQAAVPGLPHWADVRGLRLAYGVEGISRGELILSPQDFTRGGDELKITIEPLPAEASRDFVIELKYDSATTSKTPDPLRVDPNGLDLNSDGDVDISMPPGQKYSVEITHTKWPSSFDLRMLPADENQTVLVLGYRGTAPGVNHVWGPTSGANLIYYGGPRADLVESFGGDDAIWASSGNNVIRTRDGDDTVSATAGNDRVWTGNGSDYAGVGHGNNYLYLGPGTNLGGAGSGRDVIRGGPGRDRVSDSGMLDIALGAGSDEIDVQGTRGGHVSCGAGLDFQHHLSSITTTFSSCDRYTPYYKVYPPIRYDWDQEAFLYLCANGRMYRSSCRDPR